MDGLRARQKRDREGRILDAAAALFEKRGFEQTSMQDVAERAGLAVGTLYNYFRSKPELGLAIVRRDTDRGLVASEHVLKNPPHDPAGAVTKLLERAIEPFARHERRLWRELVSAALRDPKLAAGLFSSDLRLLGQLATLVRELQKRDALRAEVNSDRAAVVLYACFFTWFLAYISTDGIPLRTMRQEIAKGIELVVRGMLPNEDKGGFHNDNRTSAQRSLRRRRNHRSRRNTG